MFKVYVITNNINNKKYVGITKYSIEERFKNHLKNKSKTKKLSNAIKKYGSVNFKIELLEEHSNETIYNAEKYWIAFFNSNITGYNMTSGGEGCVDREVSAETREKLRISISKHRNSLTNEQRKQLTKAANSKKRGYKESEISKNKKSKAQKLRFSKMNKEQLLEHGRLSSQNVTVVGKQNKINALLNSYSPARIKGFKQPIIECIYCKKQGGAGIMHRFHFEKCKEKYN